jgi:drug/metabolite transporter (DMT)-like permease
MGHTVFNWTLRYVEASVVSGTILAEPVVAALLAWLVLSERPGVLTIVGGVIVLVGLYFLLKGRSAAVEPAA